MSLAILLLVTGIVYAPLRSAGFVFEDVPPSDFAGWRAETISLVTHLTPRTLTNVTERAQGTDPGTLHLGNITVHLVNALLLAALVGLSARGLFLVGVFLLHPLQSEAVSYLAARGDLLLVTFALLALCAAQLSTFWRWPLMAVCCLGAVLAKETGVVVGPLVLLWDWAHGRTISRPFLLATLALGALIAVRLLGHGASTWIVAAPPLWTFLTVQSAAILRLHALILWPSGLTIAHDWARVSPLIGTLALTSLIAMAFYAWRQRSPAVRFAVAWECVALAPRFLVPLPQYLTEHHLYLPTLGLVLAAGLVKE